jgi:predicted nuclease of predicted toxin-antitoxin system
MKLLANENFPGDTVAALRATGHDVLWARTDMAGSDDETILKRAQAEERLVLTFDKDFGNLAFQWGLPAACGVILLRLVIQSPQIATARTLNVLQSRSDWQGQFAVVDEHRVRMRPLPSARRP